MADASEVFGELPPGYAAVPILPGQGDAVLRVCAIFRTGQDSSSTGRLLLLRDRWDARVYLGAVTDAAGRVHRWVEIWVQAVEAPSASVAARGQAFTNRSLDEHWSRHADALDAASARGILRTGYEARHPPATLIDDATAQPVFAALDGQPLALCEDDAALTAAGLPAFSTSLDRYLHAAAAAREFVPVTPGAPTNAQTRPLADAVGPAGRSPFNPSAGLLIVRDHAPLALDQFVALLEAGEPGLGETFSDAADVPELVRGDGAADFTGANGTTAEGDGRLLLARQGRAGQWVETFYLKLCAWTDALQGVYRAVARVQRPLLNLSPESFRVTLGRPRHGLPSLWCSEVALCDPGDAVPLKVENAERVYFVRELGARGETAPVYRPAVATVGVSTGTAALRIRQVLPEARGVVVEATFTPRDRLAASRNDLLRVRVGLAAGRVDLYAQLQPEQAMAGGEWRVRTIPQALAPELVQQLKAAEGVPLGSVEYEHIPLLNTPADAYAMAVLLVRMLLVPPAGTLAAAVDETWSLARQVAAGYDASVPLAMRINDIFSRDERWGKHLGPKHAAGAASAVPDGAPGPLPRALWFDTLALIVSMFPGAGPDSFYTDYGDAPPNALHRALEPALAAADALLARVRSVLVVDWRLNEELGGVVRSLLRGFSAPAAKPAPTPPPPPKPPPTTQTPAPPPSRQAAGAVPVRRPTAR